MEKYPSIPLNKSGVSQIKDWQNADLSKSDRLSKSEAFGLRLGDNSLASIVIQSSTKDVQKLATRLMSRPGLNQCLLMYDINGSVHLVHRTNTSLSNDVLLDDGALVIKLIGKGHYIATSSDHQFKFIQELELLDSARLLDIIDVVREHLVVELKVPSTSFVKTSTKTIISGYKIESLSDVVNANKHLKPAKRLFGEFWRDGEVAVLFGKTNTGKTALAMQLAMDLANGTSSMSEYFPSETQPLEVLYFDFEMSDVQITRRLSGATIPENFKRVTLCLDSVKDILSIQDAIDSIVEITTEVKPDVVFIDNISAIKIKNDTAASASELMLKVNKLKKSLKIPILLIGHTPKQPFSEKITIDHLAGSAQIAIQVDVAFAIGTGSNNARYLKQLKCRDAEIEFGEDNVIKLEMTNEGMLRFKTMGTTQESEFVQSFDSISSDERNQRIVEMHSAGMSIRSIAKDVGLSPSRTHDIVRGVRPPDKPDTIDECTMDDLLF